MKRHDRGDAYGLLLQLILGYFGLLYQSSGLPEANSSGPDVVLLFS